MKKINKTNVVGLFSVLITMFASNTNVYTWPRNVSQIKGSYDCVRDGFKHLSPFKGYLWSQTKLTEHYYDFGNAQVDYDDRGNVSNVRKKDSDATIQLIHRLFYKDTGTFRCTRADATNHFTAKTIGIILATIETASEKDLQQQLSQKIREDIPAAFTQKSANKIGKLIANSYKESTGENPKYLPHTTHNILLTFLYMKVDETEYKDYFDQFHTLREGQRIFATEFNSEDFFKREDEQQFTREIERKFSSQATWEEVEPFVLDHYELFFYTGIEQAINLIASWGTAYSRNYHFADCVETSIRNFINFLIYDQVSQTFKLPDTITASEELKGFYQEFDSPKKIHSQDAHDKWAEIVSNKDAEYTHNEAERYELESTLNNFIKIFNYLFGREFKNFDDFCSTFGISYTLEDERKSDLVKYHDKNSFFIEKDGLRLFKLVIDPGHSEIYSTEEASDDDTNHKDKILEVVENNDNILAQEICYIYRPDTLCNYRFATPDITYPARQHYYMQQNLESNSNLPVILKDTLKYKPFFWLAKKIFNKIQRLDDNGLISKAMTTILESGAWKDDEIKEILINFISSETDGYQQLNARYKLDFLTTTLRYGALQDERIKHFVLNSYQQVDARYKSYFLITALRYGAPQDETIKKFVLDSYQQVDADGKSNFLTSALESGAWQDEAVKTILIRFISSETDGYQQLDTHSKSNFLQAALKSDFWKENEQFKTILTSFCSTEYQQIDFREQIAILKAIFESGIAWKEDEAIKACVTSFCSDVLTNFNQARQDEHLLREITPGIWQEILISGVWKENETIKENVIKFSLEIINLVFYLSDTGQTSFLQAVLESDIWEKNSKIRHFIINSKTDYGYHSKSLFLTVAPEYRSKFLQKALRSATLQSDQAFKKFVHDSCKDNPETLLMSGAWQRDPHLKSVLDSGYRRLSDYGKLEFLQKTLASDAWKDDVEIKRFIFDSYQQLGNDYKKYKFLEEILTSGAWKDDTEVKNFMIDSGYKQLSACNKPAFLREILTSGAWRDETIKRFMIDSGYQQLNPSDKSIFLQEISGPGAWKDDVEIKRFVVKSRYQVVKSRYQQLADWKKLEFLQEILKSNIWKDNETFKRFVGDFSNSTKFLKSILGHGVWKDATEIKNFMLDSYQQLDPRNKLAFLTSALKSGAWKDDETIKRFIINSGYQLFNASGKLYFLQEILKSNAWQDDETIKSRVLNSSQLSKHLFDINNATKFLHRTLECGIWQDATEIKNFMLASYQQLDTRGKSNFLRTALRFGAWKDEAVKTILIRFISSKTDGYQQLGDYEKTNFLEEISRSRIAEQDETVRICVESAEKSRAEQIAEQNARNMEKMKRLRERFKHSLPHPVQPPQPRQIVE